MQLPVHLREGREEGAEIDVGVVVGVVGDHADDADFDLPVEVETELRHRRRFHIDHVRLRLHPVAGIAGFELHELVAGADLPRQHVAIREEGLQLLLQFGAERGIEFVKDIFGEVLNPADAGRAAERVDVEVAVGHVRADDDVTDVDAAGEGAAQPPDDDRVAILVEDEVGGGGAGGRFARAVTGAGDVPVQPVEILRFEAGRDEKTNAHD